jgi:hypothetical protein
VATINVFSFLPSFMAEGKMQRKSRYYICLAVLLQCISAAHAIPNPFWSQQSVYTSATKWPLY